MSTAAKLEQQLAADLRALAPADTDILAVGCFEDGAGGFGFRAVALHGLFAGQPDATDLPELPAAVQQQFEQLRRAIAQDPAVRSLWEASKVMVACRPGEDGQPGPAHFYYGFPERAGNPDNDEAYNLLTAAEFNQQFAGGGPDEDEDDAPVPARRSSASAPTRSAPAAKPTVWVCTWCKQTYASERQPTSFQPDKCPRNPGKAHAWRKK